MLVMAFETASPSGGVAVLRDGRVEGEMRINNAQAHSRLALSFAEQLLAGLKLSWKDVEILAASHGPGSFTGIRVGLTAVKSLGWSLGKRVVTVSSLEALAYGAGAGLDPGRRVVALLDARLGEVYCGVFRSLEGGVMVREGEEFAAKPADIVRRLPPGCTFTGEGALRYHEQFLKSHGVLARSDVARSSPATTGWLAWRKAVDGATLKPGDVKAVYLREATVSKPPSN